MLRAAAAASLTVIARIRATDRSIGIRCADGAALRVTRQAAWLERTGRDGIAPIRRFSATLSAGLGWPPPSPSPMGWPIQGLPQATLIAGTEETARAEITRRLRRARLHHIDDDPARQSRIDGLLLRAASGSAAPKAQEALASPGETFVLVTRPCLADLKRRPKRFMGRLKELLQEAPETKVILYEEDGTATSALSLGDLVRRLAEGFAGKIKAYPPADPEPAPDERGTYPMSEGIEPEDPGQLHDVDEIEGEPESSRFSL